MPASIADVDTAGATSSAASWNLPVGIIENDLVLLFVTRDRADSIAVPAGYTLVVEVTDGTLVGTLFGKVADGTETGTVDDALSSWANWSTVTVVVRDATPAERSDATSFGADSAPVAGDVTLDVDGVAVSFYGSDTPGQSGPVGWTDLVESAATPYAGATYMSATAGPTGAQDYTTTAVAWLTVTVALSELHERILGGLIEWNGPGASTPLPSPQDIVLPSLEIPEPLEALPPEPDAPAIPTPPWVPRSQPYRPGAVT